jgi:Stage II sporulation protein E (SpoIIE)
MGSGEPPGSTTSIVVDHVTWVMIGANTPPEARPSTTTSVPSTTAAKPSMRLPEAIDAGVYTIVVTSTARRAGTAAYKAPRKNSTSAMPLATATSTTSSHDPCRGKATIELAAAALLEPGLLPPRLPRCRGLDFAARYVATEHRTVGGDWYDLFTLPSGAMWIVVGDVADHGLEAAVVMGRIRSALRAYSLIDGSPERVLDLVDSKVQHFEIGTSPPWRAPSSTRLTTRLTLGVAGHPPPVIAVPGRPTALADVEVSPPIGTNGAGRPFVDDHARARYRRRALHRRARRAPRRIHRRRACASAGSITPGAPDRVARDIMRHLLTGVVPEDDIALVVMRRTRMPADC